MFLDRDRQTYILQDDEDWVSGATTQITARHVGQSMRFTFRIEPLMKSTKSFTIDKLVLKYKCPGNSEYESAILWDTNATFNATAVNDRFCNSSLEFSITRLMGIRAYNITFLRNNLDYENTLQGSLELRMQAAVSSRRLLSAALFVINIAPIAEMNTQLEALGAVNCTRYILSKQGVQLLLGQFTPEIDGVILVGFLDKKFVDAVHVASQLIRSLLSVTVTLRFVTATSRPGCEPQPADDLALFYSGGRDSLLDQLASAARLTGHINLGTGDLMLPNHLDYLLALRANRLRLRVCLRVSLNTRDWRQEVVKEVVEFQHFATENFVARTRYGKSCDINIDLEPAQRRLILYAGLREVAVASPIVCMEPSNVQQTLIGHFCRSPAQPETSESRRRQKCGTIQVYPKGFGMAFFPEPLDSRLHSGALTFTYGPQHHQFNLTVISPPVFATKTHWSGLISNAVVTHSYPLTLRCAAFRAYLPDERVIVSASFLIDNVTGYSDRADLSLFSRNFLLEGPKFIKAEQHERDRLLSVLEIRIPALRQKKNYTELKFSLVCEVAVQENQARMLGVNSFETLTHAAVLLKRSTANQEANRGSRLGGFRAMLLTAALQIFLMCATAALLA